MLRQLLDFWQTDVGEEYNPQRFAALKSVVLVSSLEEALQEIEQDEKKRPLLIATSAKAHDNVPAITYYDQEKVWTLQRPVVFLLGTARGLAPSLIEKCDFLLGPIKGFSTFNHLSVRSAAAIIFDRWLSIQSKINYGVGSVCRTSDYRRLISRSSLIFSFSILSMLT